MWLGKVRPIKPISISLIAECGGRFGRAVAGAG
jgi:hypothetical protein